MHGTFRQDRHGKEIQAGEAKFPTPPKFLVLSKRERRIWRFVGRHCRAWSALSDWPVVWGLVRMIERLIRCQDAQRETDDAGHPLAFKHTIRHVPRLTGGRDRVDDVEQIEIVEARSNPLVLQEIKLFEKLRPFISMLGLSPVDRARMPKLEDPQKTDPLDALTRRMK